MLALDRMRLSRIAGAIWFLSSCAGLPAKAETCPDSGDEHVEVSAVGPRLELRLADGRMVRLVGLDPAGQTPDDPDLEDRSRTAFAKLIVGRNVSVRVLSAAPDRWNRIVALGFVSAPAEGERSDNLAARAIGLGFGRYLAEPAARGCRNAFIAAETIARTAKLGLWSDPYYAVLAVDDQTAFVERSGTVVVAEGRLTAIVPGPFRTKLRFASPDQGSHGGHTLSATILPRTMKTFEGRRLILSSFLGRVLRLRGLLDLRFGPQIEIADPDQIEVIGRDVEALPTGRAN